MNEVDFSGFWQMVNVVFALLLVLALMFAIIGIGCLVVLVAEKFLDLTGSLWRRMRP